MHAVAFLGALRDGRFEGALAGRLDHGDVFYAPALMTDASERALLWGWAQEREPPGTLSHAGALTLPRELLVAGDEVLTRPVPELEAMRRERLARAGSQVELAATFGGRAGSAGWTLGDARVSVDFDRHRLEVVADRRMTAPLPPADEHSARVFLDGSLLEVFADDGRAAITTRCYAEAARPELLVDDGVDVLESAAWRLSPP